MRKKEKNIVHSAEARATLKTGLKPQQKMIAIRFCFIETHSPSYSIEGAIDDTAFIIEK